VRANKSEKLLLSTNLNITEISESCGFSDPQYYYQAFKKWYKCTPRQFRNIYRDRMEKSCNEEELELNIILEPLNDMILNHHLDLFLF
jgi:AraC-like DNA-binding protein